MIYLLAIITGLCIGTILHRWSRQTAAIARLGLPLLLIVIFLMGTEVDLRLLETSLVWRAIVLGIVTMLGSVACLSLLLLLLRKNHDH
jgi:Kef-type K+ transport system membrane component KefB